MKIEMKIDVTRAKVLLVGASNVNPALQACIVKRSDANFKRLALPVGRSIPKLAAARGQARLLQGVVIAS